MTSRLLKNRPTTRANTHRWNRLELVVLGVWLAATSPSALWAEQPSAAGRASVGNESSSSTAVDRWRRLKSLYPIQESPEPATSRSADVPRAAKIEVPVRPIPDESATDSEQPALESDSRAAEPVSSGSAPVAIESALPSSQRRPALPVAPVDEEPAWVVPVAVEPDIEPDFKINPTDDGGVHALEPTHIVPAPVDVPAAVVREAVSQESSSSARLAAKHVSHVEAVPTRIRRIDSINPFRSWTADGRESDHDVREWSRKQTSELNLAFGTGPFPERAFPATVKPWEAANFFYYPLYFEDPALERYGHTHHPLIQPFVSVGRFGTQLVALPYQMTIDPPCREVYSLGWYRPGDCAPKLHYQVPLNAHAAVVEAATITGLVFLIP